jgi:UDP-glucose 4-epimerase
MQEKKLELKVRKLFKKMLEDAALYAETEEYYAEDMKDFNEKVQWKFGPIKGYQVFKETEYSFKIDEEIEDPDLILGCDDLDLARRFLNSEIEHWPAFGATDFQVTMKTADGSYLQTSVGGLTGPAPTAALATDRSLTMRLVRIPAFRQIMERTFDPENSNDVRIPINKSLGTFQNQALPLGVLEYFINKASHVYLFPMCPCRVQEDCQNYDQMEFGCMALGKGVLRMKTFGEIGTKEEAIKRSRAAVAAGLLPSLGRVKSDTIIYNALPEIGDLMHLCFCCPCCCVEGASKDSPRYLRQWHVKMEGVSVTVDSELCEGCGKCLDVCIYAGREIVDDKAVVDREGEDRCRGCGRCERVCSTGATSITMEDNSVERMIARIEFHVDVT